MGKQPIADIFEAFRQAQADQADAFGAVTKADEWEMAAQGECPAARKCESLRDLARWFTLAGISAAGIARIGRNEGA